MMMKVLLEMLWCLNFERGLCLVEIERESGGSLVKDQTKKGCDGDEMTRK